VEVIRRWQSFIAEGRLRGRKGLGKQSMTA